MHQKRFSYPCRELPNLRLSLCAFYFETLYIILPTSGYFVASLVLLNHFDVCHFIDERQGTPQGQRAIKRCVGQGVANLTGMVSLVEWEGCAMIESKH